MAELGTVCLLLVVLAAYANGQQDQDWVWNLQSLSVAEDTGAGVFVQQLQANYRGSSDIIYGINNNPLDLKDNSYKQEGNRFRVFPNGTVFTLNAELDFEGDENQFSLNVIALLRSNEDIFLKRQTTVFVQDVNDNAPQFKNSRGYEASVNETNIPPPAGTLLVKGITVTDADLKTYVLSQRYITCNITRCRKGTDKEEFPCGDMFSIRQVNLKSAKEYIGDFYINYNHSLNYEDGEVYQVTITAYDGVHTESSDVAINVIDEQDSPPIWIDLPSLLEHMENTSIYSNLGMLKAEDSDGNKELRRNISYILLNTTDSNVDEEFHPEKYFGIEQFTGEVYNKYLLDREAPPFSKHPENNLWKINVLACEIIQYTPLKIGSTIGLDCVNGTTTVKINDINDNYPVFNNHTTLYVYNISEDVRNGENLNNPRIKITDADSDQFNKFTVRFTTISNEFQLSATDRSPVIQVKNTSLIDYDYGKRRYDLVLEARDNEDNTLFSRASVIINILDANDNRPIFNQTSYERSIYEDAKPGTNIITINATDIDENLAGTAGIKYTLEGIYSNLFSINAETGQVKVGPCAGTPGVHTCIDYERAPNDYTFKVRAQDEKGKGQNPSYTNLVIRILDVNDNLPSVGDYTVSIIENTTKTSPDLFVEAVDADERDVLTYSIISGQTYWTINSATGHITATQPIKYNMAPLDGRGKPRFHLVVQVSDGKPDHNVLSNVIIKVLDTNDNPPVFLPGDHTEEIPETMTGVNFIWTVTATDADDSTLANGVVTYEIYEGSLGKFTIDKTNGSVYTHFDATFDYDVQNKYTLLLHAKDGGSPQLTGTFTLTVLIRDANNKAPYFVPFTTKMEVYDNSPIDYTIKHLTAVDPDATARLRYYFKEPKTGIDSESSTYITDSNIFNNLFRIDNETAAVIVNQKLDYNKVKYVTYSCSVFDIAGTGTAQEGTGTVIINIKPYNVNPPVIANYSNHMTLQEELGDGTSVTSFIATDDGGIIKDFKITRQSHDFFKISDTSGVVTINSRIDYEKKVDFTNSSYFEVVVTDSGQPTLSATAYVTVDILNINDNFPTFSQGVYIAELDENAEDGTELIYVYATDDDRHDENGFDEIRYSMDDNRFQIHPVTGLIRVRRRNNATLDREETPTLIVQVLAADTPKGPASVRKQRVASVEITLRDKNDNPPKFHKKSYFAKIYETIDVRTEILQLFTTDIDLGLFGEVAYSKVENVGNDTLDLFGVNAARGHIYVKKSLLHHVKTYPYHFQVRATDENGKGPFTSTAEVYILVMPSANSPPRFVRPPKDNVTIFVLEEQYNGMFVYDVSAVDDDSGLNGVVDYYFVHVGEQRAATDEFLINRVTGVIQAEIIYDREKRDKYVLLLKARDRGQTPLETTRFLTVVVLDVNDNDPYFKEHEIEFRIVEDAPLNTPVEGNKKIEAFDLDLDPVIYYEIISGNEDEAFWIDRMTGKLYTNKILDTEVKDVYTLSVRATNDEPDDTVIRNRRRRAVDPSIITVKILVGDINDLAPVFLGAPYYGCVSSRSSFDKHIVTVSAVDYDAKGSRVVRYRLMNEVNNGNGQPLFGIHDTFGVVSNKVLMREYTDNTFDLIVNARDRENIASAESVNTTVKIYVTQPSKEAKLLIKQNTAEVRLYQNQIQRIIEGSPYLDRMCINIVRDHVINTAGATSPLWSDVYISGMRIDSAGRATIISSVELKNIIDTEMGNRPQDFDNLYISTVEAASSDETSVKDSFVLIVMIIIAVLIFLVILFIILAYLCIRAAKQEKKSRLIQRTQAGPPPVPVIVEKHVEPIPVVFQAPEPVQYDNRAYIIEQQGSPAPQEQMVVEPEPVHVQYAVVQKRSEALGMEVVRMPTPEPVDQEDIIIVSQFRDEPQPVGEAVFQPREEEEEFRIVTETM